VNCKRGYSRLELVRWAIEDVYPLFSG